MKRKQVYLTKRQVLEIKQRSSNIGISSSELIRRILDNYLDSLQNNENKVKK